MSTPRTTSSTFLTLAQVCAELGVARSTLAEWRQVPGRAPRFIRLPEGQLRCRRAALDPWVPAPELA